LLNPNLTRRSTQPPIATLVPAGQLCRYGAITFTRVVGARPRGALVAVEVVTGRSTETRENHLRRLPLRRRRAGMPGAQRLAESPGPGANAPEGAGLISTDAPPQTPQQSPPREGITPPLRMTVMANPTTAAGATAHDTGSQTGPPILQILFILSKSGSCQGPPEPGRSSPPPLPAPPLRGFAPSRETTLRGTEDIEISPSPFRSPPQATCHRG